MCLFVYVYICAYLYTYIDTCLSYLSVYSYMPFYLSVHIHPSILPSIYLSIRLRGAWVLVYLLVAGLIHLRPIGPTSLKPLRGNSKRGFPPSYESWGRFGVRLCWASKAFVKALVWEPSSVP